MHVGTDVRSAEGPAGGSRAGKNHAFMYRLRTGESGRSHHVTTDSEHSLTPNGGENDLLWQFGPTWVPDSFHVGVGSPLGVWNWSSYRRVDRQPHNPSTLQPIYTYESVKLSRPPWARSLIPCEWPLQAFFFIIWNSFLLLPFLGGIMTTVVIKCFDYVRKNDQGLQRNNAFVFLLLTIV